MAVFKCKMCGGALEINSESGVAVCEYCGSVQTLPKRNDEVIANLFNRANNLRIKCEFDKAAQVYEKILNEDNSDAEAHWGLLLCKYGIEYVEDPKTYKRIPTCHRTQYESVLSDVDYLSALANSDGEAKNVYKTQAEEISELQKNILAIVKNEKPFDVFICYKETDENGKRTVDSALANDIYYQLTQEGLKVFYAAITLEDKLGQEYEPYIFAALNSAKVMLVVGTKPEYFDSVWVRNEWSRYLKLMKTDRSRLLIPCYRDMDAYDLPEEFAHLQAQDMSKIGFVNDVVRGIKKVVDQPNDKKSGNETAVKSSGSNTASLLERAFMFLEDGDWQSADEYCEKVLDIEPKNATAYLGKLMAELRVKRQKDLKDCIEPFDNNKNYQKAIRFADATFATELRKNTPSIEERNVRKVKKSKKNKKRLIYATILTFLMVIAVAVAVVSYNSYMYELSNNSTGVTITSFRVDCPESLVIPECINGKTVTEIGDNAFEESHIGRKINAKSISVPSSVTKIGQSAFMGCEYLEEINIPASCSQIGSCALKDCNNLKTIHFGGTMEEWDKINFGDDWEPSCVYEVYVLVDNESVATSKIKYDNAIKLYNEGEFQEAYDLFVSLNGYQDSLQMIAKCTEKNWEQMLSHVWGTYGNPYYEITFNFDNKTAHMEFHSVALDESYSGTFEIVDFDTIIIPEGLIDTFKSNNSITLKRWNNKCLTRDNSKKYDPVLIIRN